MASLLEKANTPKFIYICTMLASIAMIKQVPSLSIAYGMSKVAGNYMTKRIDAENKHLIVLSVTPEYIQLRFLQAIKGLEKAPVTIDETVSGITTQIDAANKLTTSGQFVHWNADSAPR
ncbi:NADP(+)-dependent dehydrogenase [Penicillium verhagenii]|nr:NADP(+)-dependent dehydrogenase [Penicillium verhagenii]